MTEQQTFQHKDQLIERGQRDCIMHAPDLFFLGGVDCLFPEEQGQSIKQLSQ